MRAARIFIPVGIQAQCTAFVQCHHERCHRVKYAHGRVDLQIFLILLLRLAEQRVAAILHISSGLGSIALVETCDRHSIHIELRILDVVFEQQNITVIERVLHPHYPILHL
jgi:hypothetical protein